MKYFSFILVKMSLGILDVYFEKKSDQVIDEYNSLIASGRINSTDYDLKMVIIMNSLLTTPDIFSDEEVSIMNSITLMRKSNIYFTFDSVYPILKILSSNVHTENRAYNIANINSIVTLGLVTKPNDLDLSPPAKNNSHLRYSSPVLGLSEENGRESYNPVYCEWNK